MWEEERAGAGGRLRQGVCGLIAVRWEGQRIRKLWSNVCSTFCPSLYSYPPQFVWVDVDPSREAAAASDKAQETAPVLWVKKKVKACTDEGGSVSSRPPLQSTSHAHPKARQAVLCPLLTIGEIVQSLPKVLHSCVRWFEVLKPSWRGEGRSSRLALTLLVLKPRPFGFTALSPRTH